ncbi:uncharacterized protein BO66DRAFT_163805 [Aspergillus aculeatinus CBS 121060]|uniref:Uncharacterized protein n=1 Tax=Aspergillus aculeatinus CBS 121060 TaxID=1448322 RepID=A0ACD1H0G0_9EURO|nr:hypothetical protein BO66DRAFT_163805 [Aspergillus aculeatinus CBS 121060]RAH66905.1 hypothetical protein BO66DRAFT_163805 [Aspergillus aculeatinus CBS 121060]
MDCAAPRLDPRPKSQVPSRESNSIQKKWGWAPLHRSIWSIDQFTHSRPPHYCSNLGFGPLMAVDGKRTQGGPLLPNYLVWGLDKHGFLLFYLVVLGLFGGSVMRGDDDTLIWGFNLLCSRDDSGPVVVLCYVVGGRGEKETDRQASESLPA